MTHKHKLTRRLFLSFSVFPAILQAAPLVDFEHGLGLFSSSGSTQSWENSYKVNLFNDPEPEIDSSVRLELNHSENIFVKDHFQLRLINSNTSHEMMFNFPSNYTLSSGEVASLDNFLRDWRTDEIKRIDTLVLTDFLKICSLCAKENKVLKVNVHSGFRSKKTNAYLRKQSYKVAQNSLHIIGKAIDFSIPDISPRRLAEIVRANTRGGVGRYKTFIHLDSGPERSWS